MGQCSFCLGYLNSKAVARLHIITDVKLCPQEKVQGFCFSTYTSLKCNKSPKCSSDNLAVPVICCNSLMLYSLFHIDMTL